MDESGRRTAGRSFLGERKGDTGKLPETWEKRGGDCRIVVKKEGFSEEEWIQMLCNGVCACTMVHISFPGTDEDAGKTESIRKQGFTV